MEEGFVSWFTPVPWDELETVGEALAEPVPDCVVDGESETGREGDQIW